MTSEDVGEKHNKQEMKMAALQAWQSMTWEDIVNFSDCTGFAAKFETVLVAVMLMYPQKCL